jgi:nucleoid-associated protein YgaU
MPVHPHVQRARHRKPSNTGKTLAKTALAGAVVSSPLVTAAQAQAAPDNVWDKVAQCESGGNWGISTGNGFQGGLQFTQSTWRSFGGGQFASSANRASREQQIAVAEKVLAGQGWNAWPVCSRKADARGAGATPRVITAKAPVKSIGRKNPARITPATRSTGKHALRPADPAPKPLTQTPALPAAPLTQAAAAPAPVIPVAGKLTPVNRVAAPNPSPLRTLPVNAPAPAAPAPAVPVPALQAPVLAAPAGPARPAPAAPAPAPGNTVLADQSAPAAPRTYQVHAGDTLSGIAGSQHVTGGWRAIYEANRGALNNANLIRPGQQLNLT